VACVAAAHAASPLVVDGDHDDRHCTGQGEGLRQWKEPTKPEGMLKQTRGRMQIRRIHGTNSNMIAHRFRHRPSRAALFFRYQTTEQHLMNSTP
jgi:hypothetical protein